MHAIKELYINQNYVCETEKSRVYLNYASSSFSLQRLSSNHINHCFFLNALIIKPVLTRFSKSRSEWVNHNTTQTRA